MQVKSLPAGRLLVLKSLAIIGREPSLIGSGRCFFMCCYFMMSDIRIGLVTRGSCAAVKKYQRCTKGSARHVGE